MDDDAFVPSQNATNRSPEQPMALPKRVQTLEDLAFYLHNQVERALARCADTAARLEHDEARISENRETIRDAVSLLEAVRQQAAAGDAAEAGAPRHAAPPKRDRHGMHLVRGSAAVAMLAAVGRWLPRRGVHRAVTLAAATVAGGAIATAPAVMTTHADPARPGAVAAPHHGRYHHGREGAPLAAAAPRRRRRCHHDHDDAVAQLLADEAQNCREDRVAREAAAPVPSAPGPSPSPSPSPTGIVPTPVITPTLPVPSGTPLPTAPAGGLLCQLPLPPCHSGQRAVTMRA